MGARPLIYCCVPREGIMTMTFWYGLSHWWILLFLAFLYTLSDEQFEFLRKAMEVDDDVEDTIVEYLIVAARIVLGYVYFYACYLTYIRRFKPISKLLYFFAADILWDLWFLTMAFREEFRGTMKESKITVNEIQGIEEKYEVTVEMPIKFGRIIWFLLIFLIPFINKIYVIMKIRAYTKYVEYKKDETESSSNIYNTIDY